MASSVWDHLLEHPADLDALRVYADSLLETNDGRGELIHIALALEELPDWDPRRDPLAARLRTLRRQYERTWTAPALTALQTGGSWYGLSVELKRGIPAVLSVDARTLLRDAEHVFRLAPISDLRVYAVRGVDLGPLAALAQLSRLRGLELHFGNVAMPGADELRAFFDAVRLDALEALAIDVRDFDTAKVLAGATSLPRLRRLTLEPALIPLEQNLSRARTHIGARGLELLLASPQLKGLTALRLVRQNLGAAGALLLAEATALTRLELSGNALGSVGVEVLARSASRGQLTRLALTAEAPRVAGLEALAGADFPKLHTLELDGDASLGVDGLETLAQARWAGQLRKLKLAASGLEVKAMRALAGTPALKALQVLSLANNPLGDRGAAALGRAGSLPALRELDLTHTELGAEGVAALAAGPLLAAVEVLDLSHNLIGEEGGEALGQGASLTRLRQLVLSHNGLGALGLRGLLSNPAVGALEEVSTGMNDLEAELLAEFLEQPHLKLAVLRVARATARQVEALIREPRAAGLRELHLGMVAELDDALAKKLEASPYLKELGVLSFGSRTLSAAGEDSLRRAFGPRLVKTL